MILVFFIQTSMIILSTMRKNQGYIMSGYENKCSISQNLYSPQQCTVRNAWDNRKFLVDIPINFNGNVRKVGRW